MLSKVIGGAMGLGAILGFFGLFPWAPEVSPDARRIIPWIWAAMSTILFAIERRKEDV